MNIKLDISVVLKGEGRHNVLMHFEMMLSTL